MGRAERKRPDMKTVHRRRIALKMAFQYLDPIERGLAESLDLYFGMVLINHYGNSVESLPFDQVLAPNLNDDWVYFNSAAGKYINKAKRPGVRQF